MALDSQAKILWAGFIIIRKDDYPQLRIKSLELTGPLGNTNFITLAKLPTKAARDRQFRKHSGGRGLITKMLIK